MSDESLLKKKRLEKKLSIYDVEKILKIRAKHIEALEEGKYTDMPGITYCIGYLKAYSALLGLSEEEKEEIIKEIKKAFGKENKRQFNMEKEVIKLDEEEPKEDKRKETNKKNTTKSVVFAIIIVLIGTLTFFGFKLFSYEGEFTFSKKGRYTPYIKVTPKEGSVKLSDKDSLTPEETSFQTPQETPISTPTPTPVPKIMAKFNISIKSKGEGWVKVFTKEKILFDNIIIKGKEYVFKSDTPITFILEDSNLFSIYVNDEILEIPKGRFIKYTVNKELESLNNG